MSQKLCLKVVSPRIELPVGPNQKIPPIYTPGQIITEQKEFMRGHGTYEHNGFLKSSVAGIRRKVNNLISVYPLKSRYNGEVGDVVVGRIIEVLQKRWKVETNSKLDSILLLSSVNLPGGELRRRSVEDEHMMRHYLQEGDLISAEVQSVFSDGSLSLHTRSLKYGKLSQGILVKVFPSLIKRSKTHFYNLYVGASIILGSNGFIWICPTSKNSEDGVGGFVQNLEEVVSKPERETICRLRNCILALSEYSLMLYDTSILFAYEESLKYAVSDLLLPEPMADLVILVNQRLNMAEAM